MKRNTLEKENLKQQVILGIKCFLLIYSMLIAIGPLNHLLYFTRKPVCGGLLGVMVYLLITDFRHFLKKEYVIAGLFSCCYVVTILLNRDSHFINELMILGYTVTALFVMTYVPESCSPEQVRKEWKILAWCLVITACLQGIANLVIFILAFPAPAAFSQATGLYGIHHSQLGGLYNPNTGAVICYVSGLLALLLFRGTSAAGKCFLGFHMAVQLVCFSLAQSRGAWMCLMVFVFLYFLLVWRSEYIRSFRRGAAALCLAAACVAVLAVGARIVRSGVELGVRQIAIHTVQEQENMERPEDPGAQNPESLPNQAQNPKVESEPVHPAVDGESIHQAVTRPRQAEFTTGRMGIWKAGLQMFRSQPIFGIGYRSIDDGLHALLTQEAYDNSAAGGLHNMYLTVLVSCGIVGFLLFAALIVCFLGRAWKILRQENTHCTAKILAAFLGAFLVGELVESRILLQLNNMTVLFWLLCGYLMYISGKEDRHNA